MQCKHLSNSLKSPLQARACSANTSRTVSSRHCRRERAVQTPLEQSQVAIAGASMQCTHLSNSLKSPSQARACSANTSRTVSSRHRRREHAMQTPLEQSQVAIAGASMQCKHLSNSLKSPLQARACSALLVVPWQCHAGRAQRAATWPIPPQRASAGHATATSSTACSRRTLECAQPIRSHSCSVS